jgi:hypothetical protein
MLRKMNSLYAVVVAVALFANNPSHAQTNGEPLISTGGTGSATSPAYIDAYIQTGGTSGSSDVCLRIQSVYNNSTLIPPGTSATVDARGFTTNNAPTGGWVCSVNPFAQTGSTTNLVGKSGRLLLGYIDIPAKFTWVIPTHIIVEGIGTNGTGIAGANTMIHADASLASWGGSPLAVMQLGLAGSTANISFGIQVRNLSVDCANVNGASGILNLNSEEGSLVNNVQIFDCPVFGLRVSTNGIYSLSPGHGAVNSGPYEDVFINYTSCSNCSSTTTIALQVDGDNTSSSAGRSIRGFDNFTVSGNHLPSPKPTLIYVYGVSTTITNSHVEYCAVACIQIGQTGTPSYDTVGVRLSDITVGVNNGGYDVVIAAGSSTVAVGNILVENLNHETTTNSNTLKDNVTVYTAGDTYLGWYFLGAGTTPAVFTSSTNLAPTSADSLRVIGNADFTGNITKGGGSFRIDHPLDPGNEYLSHSFVESPDMMNVYNGSVTTDRHGLATVILPDYFEALNRDFRYQLTPVGQFAQAMVAEKVKGNRFVIKTNKPGVEVSWQVTGIRHDAYANQHRIPVEEPKPESLRQH